MLLTIHNLPATTRYADIKSLLQSKCGLQHVILDNLIGDGAGKKVTVGVAEDADAAILTRKINGLYWNGQQLYVEDVRQQKTASEQPFRSTNPELEESTNTTFGSMNLQQHSSYNAKGMGLAPNMLAPAVQPMMAAMYYVPDYTQSGGFAQGNNYIQGQNYASTPATQKVQSAYMGISGFNQTAQIPQVGMVSVNKNQQEFFQPEDQGSGWGNDYNEEQDFAAERPLFRPQSAVINNKAEWTSDQQNRHQESPPCDRSHDNREQWAPRGSDNRGSRPTQPDFRPNVRPNDRSGFKKPRPDFRPNDRPGLLENPRPDFGSNDRPGLLEKPRPGFGSNDRPSLLEKPRPVFGLNNQERRNQFSGKQYEFSGRSNEFSGRPNEREAFSERPREYSGRSNERRGPNEFGRPNERQPRPNEHQGRSNEYQRNEFSERKGRPNDRPGPSRPIRSEFDHSNGRDEFRRSTDRSEFSRRDPSDSFTKPDRGYPKSNFPDSRKRKFDERFEEREIERPERPSRPPNRRPTKYNKPTSPSRLFETAESKEKFSKKMFYAGFRKILFEIINSLGIQTTDATTRQIHKKVLVDRINNIYNGRTVESPIECYELYRDMYPASQDQKTYDKVLETVAKIKANEALGSDTEVAEELEPEAEVSSKPPPPKLTRVERDAKKKFKEANHLLSQGKVPTFPQGDKRKVAQQKREEKVGHIPVVSSPYKEAINEEVHNIADLFVHELNNASDATQQRAYNTVSQVELTTEIEKNPTETNPTIMDIQQKLIQIASNTHCHVGSDSNGGELAIGGSGMSQDLPAVTNGTSEITTSVLDRTGPGQKKKKSKKKKKVVEVDATGASEPTTTVQDTTGPAKKKKKKKSKKKKKEVVVNAVANIGSAVLDAKGPELPSVPIDISKLSKVNRRNRVRKERRRLNAALEKDLKQQTEGSLPGVSGIMASGGVKSGITTVKMKPSLPLYNRFSPEKQLYPMKLEGQIATLDNAGQTQSRIQNTAIQGPLRNRLEEKELKPSESTLPSAPGFVASATVKSETTTVKVETSTVVSRSSPDFFYKFYPIKLKRQFALYDPGQSTNQTESIQLTKGLLGDGPMSSVHSSDATFQSKPKKKKKKRKTIDPCEGTSKRQKCSEFASPMSNNMYLGGSLSISNTNKQIGLGFPLSWVSETTDDMVPQYQKQMIAEHTNVCSTAEIEPWSLAPQSEIPQPRYRGCRAGKKVLDRIKKPKFKVVILDKAKVHMDSYQASVLKNQLEQHIVEYHSQNLHNLLCDKPRFTSIPRLALGGLKVEVRDVFSLSWLVGVVGNLPGLWLGSKGYTVVKEQDIPKYHKGVVIVPDFEGDGQSIRDFLAFYNNHLRISSWPIFAQLVTKNLKGNKITMVFGIPVDEYETLMQAKCRLAYKMSYLYVRVEKSDRVDVITPAVTDSEPIETFPSKTSVLSSSEAALTSGWSDRAQNRVFNPQIAEEFSKNHIDLLINTFHGVFSDDVSFNSAQTIKVEQSVSLTHSPIIKADIQHSTAGFATVKTPESNNDTVALAQKSTIARGKNLVQTLSRRISDTGLKVVRIYGHPKLPKREVLEKFLLRYGVQSLRKSDKAMMYTAAVDTYKNHDRLCAMEPVAVTEGITISFKPFHLAPKQKANQQLLRVMRKKIINGMIEKSDLNLLDKDWPAKEAEIKEKQAALEAAEAQKKEEEDQKETEATQKNEELNEALDTPNDVQEVDLAEQDETINDATNDYLDADFHVIDEVNETDSDVEFTGDKEIIVNLDDTTNDGNDDPEDEADGNDVQINDEELSDNVLGDDLHIDHIDVDIDDVNDDDLEDY